MITTYCNEGQSEASITIDGITYKTDKPPLCVEQINGRISRWMYYKTVYASVSTTATEIPNTRYIVGSDTKITAFQYFNDVYGRNNDIYVNRYVADVLINQSIFPVNRAEINDYANFAFGLYLLEGNPVEMLKISDTEKQILIIEKLPYTINCDGCGEGECKGNKSRYPGYDCLDCANLQRQLKSMGVKIDGITKR